MSEHARAFVYFEPATRYHRGGVFPDREAATRWAEKIAAERGESDWLLNVRLGGRWVGVGARRLIPVRKRRRSRVLR